MPIRLWERPWWATPASLATAWLVLLLYGSMIPFDLRWDRFIDVPTLLRSPRWIGPQGDVSSLGIPTGASDLMANLALYLPVGVLLRLALMRWTGSGVAQILGAMLIGGGFCYGVECAQSLSPSRVAALDDVVANILGTTIGAAAAVRIREAVWSRAVALQRRYASVMLPALDVLRRERHRPGPRIALVAAAGIVAAWLTLEAPTASVASGLPFVAEFRRPYDVAGVLITQTLAGYLAIATLLAVCFMQRTPTVTLAQLMLGVSGFTAAISGARWWIWDLPPSATEPAIAALAVGGWLAAAFTIGHAVRQRCRRRESIPVQNDRRRRPHDYTVGAAR